MCRRNHPCKIIKSTEEKGKYGKRTVQRHCVMKRPNEYSGALAEFTGKLKGYTGKKLDG